MIVLPLIAGVLTMTDAPRQSVLPAPGTGVPVPETGTLVVGDPSLAGIRGGCSPPVTLGERWTPEMQAKTAEARQGGTVRVLRQGDQRTMDFQEHRLNIILDAENRIIGLRCG